MASAETSPAYGQHRVRQDASARVRQRSVLIRVGEGLASLKLTVTLFAMAIFIILAGTLAQAENSLWQVIEDYFRTAIRVDRPEELSDFPAAATALAAARDSVSVPRRVADRRHAHRQPDCRPWFAVQDPGQGGAALGRARRDGAWWLDHGRCDLQRQRQRDRRRDVAAISDVAVDRIRGGDRGALPGIAGDPAGESAVGGYGANPRCRVVDFSGHRCGLGDRHPVARVRSGPPP